MLNKQKYISEYKPDGTERRKKISLLKKVLINFRKKPILLARFFHLFMALAIFISTDSQLTKFQF